MANYANQKLVYITNVKQIHSDEPQNKGEQFLYSTSWKYIMAASKILSHTAFKVWLYFLKWDGKGQVEFSPVDVYESFGVSETSARRAFTELEEYGYLNKVEDKKNTYNFTPIATKAVAETAKLEV